MTERIKMIELINWDFEETGKRQSFFQRWICTVENAVQPELAEPAGTCGGGIPDALPVEIIPQLDAKMALCARILILFANTHILQSFKGSENGKNYS